MKKLLDFLFSKAEEINGANRCPTYLYRWTVLKWGKQKKSGLYLHRFVADDWSLDLHDHPKKFISIGLWGKYEELTPCPCAFLWCSAFSSKVWKAPWFRSFPAEHKHRLVLNGGQCWTLVIVGDSTRPWGFWHRGKFIPFREYVDSELADKMKACGD